MMNNSLINDPDRIPPKFVAIFSTITSTLNFNYSKTINQNDLIKMFPEEDIEEILIILDFFKTKHYINYELNNKGTIINLKLRQPVLDLIDPNRDNFI